MAAVSPNLRAELNGAEKGGPEHDAQIFGQVTDLFLSNVDHLSESQINSVDGVLVGLIGRVEATMLVDLSEDLSAIEKAPRQTIRALALHDDPLVATPVLRRSNGLSEADLLEIVNSGRQRHLLAICDRKILNEKLTDALMRFGAVHGFAVRGEYTNVVAALALKADVKPEAIEALLGSDRLYGLIVACKAARLSWSTTTMIVRNRPGCPPPTQRELDQCVAIHESLLLSVAQWTIRFGTDRLLAGKTDRSSPQTTAGKKPG